MKTTSIVPAILAAGIAGLCSRSLAQTLFTDTFESNTQANYDLRLGYYTADVSTNDYTVEWAYDYSAQTYNFFTSATADADPRIVPPAPNSAPGETHAVKITVNKNDDEAGRFAVNLYPKTSNFSGNFVLKFDAFLNHGAYADSGAGTTEYLLFGINHVGDKVNWGVTSGASMATSFATDAVGGAASDGLWFGFVGDDGALRSFQAFEGNAGGPSTFLDGPLGGLIDRDGNGVGDDDAGDPYIKTAFPAPPFEAPGLPGKRWVQVELSQIGNVIKWTIDGKTIAVRTNSSPWTSGRVMIGYADTFAGVAGLKDENWLLVDNIRVEGVRTVTVDTADNGSTAGDGKTSFLEALSGLQNNDRIAFNIPGAGPHYIVTPAAGYPLISAQNVVIDGFTQPGSSANTAPINGTNNASLKIVLDSRAGGRFALTEYGDNGFGASESAILPVFFSRNFTLRGVSVLSATGGDSDEDPFIYGVALVGGSTGARIQGCWFGVDPANPTAAGVRGGRAAVASFRWDENTTASGLIVGTDSDGYGDTNEFNLLTGQLLAIHLQTPYVRVSGNQFNYLPDGSVFDYSKVAGYLGEYDMEAIENGGGDYMLIGTDGDGVYDANERNYFGPIKYGVFTEFWRPALGVTFAGNSIGYGLNGTVTHTNPTPAGLLEIRAVSTIRIGSDYSGPAESDALDANYIANLGVPIIHYHGSNTSSDQPARVSFRGNVMFNNEGEAPLDPTSNLTAEKFYTLALTVPTDNRPTIMTNGGITTTNLLRVLVPARNTLNVVEPISLEVYLADPKGLTNVTETYPNGWVQSLTFLKHVELDGTFDGGNADIDISDLNLSTADLRRVTVSASYKVIASPATDTVGAVPAAYVTTPFSPTLGGEDLAPIVVTIGRAAGGVGLSWTGGAAPYQVQFRPTLTGTWQSLLSTGATSVEVPTTNTFGFFRISSGN